MEVLFRSITVEDAAFICSLFSHYEYATIFYENDTTEENWKERIPELLKNRGIDSYIIVTSDTKENIGWIMYELFESKECKLHIIMLNHDLLGKGYGYTALNLMMSKVDDSVTKITLDVQQANDRAIKLYKKFGFVIVGEETQLVGDGKTEKYFNMEYDLKK